MQVKTKSKNYNISFLNTKNYEAIVSEILENIDFKNCIILTEIGVPSQYSENIKSELEKKSIKTYKITLPKTGEINKEFSTLENVMSEIFTNTKSTRDTVIIGIGGGVIGDLSGFVSSILLRGVRFIQIPTTLLSMTDSSIGGKTGINGFGLKNIIGSFYQPDFVLINTFFLKTLTYNQYISGYCEIIKHAIITQDGEELFEFLIKNQDKILNRDIEFLQKIIKKSCEIKAKIVEIDELETLGIRSFLNFGHTIAHAIEKLPSLNHNILHGIAVGIGMIYELKLAQKIGILQNKNLLLKLKTHLEFLKIPIKLQDIAQDENLSKKLLEKMILDKKNSYSDNAEIQISFALPGDFGKMENIKITENKCKEILDEILL